MSLPLKSTCLKNYRLLRCKNIFFLFFCFNLLFCFSLLLVFLYKHLILIHRLLFFLLLFCSFRSLIGTNCIAFFFPNYFCYKLVSVFLFTVISILKVYVKSSKIQYLKKADSYNLFNWSC